MNLIKHTKYKDSGIEWIVDIPQGWEIHKLKYKSIINSKNLPEDCDPRKEIKYLDISNVDSIGNIHNIEELLFDDAPSRARRIPKSGNTLISTVRTYLKAVTFLDSIPDNFIVSTGFAVIEPINTIVPKFLFYAIISELFIQNVIAVSKGVAYPAINPSELGQIHVIISPIEEQYKIVQYLDKETSKIELIINKDTKLIELLKEKKTSLINHAVTKGLDKDVPMKDSGIEWIGDIPVEWKICRIDKISTIGRGASPRPIDDPIFFDENGEYSWVRISDVSLSTKYLENTFEKLSNLGKSLSVPLEPERLFISIAGSVGKPIITKIKCCIHDGFVYFNNLKANNEFLYYIFYGGQAYLGLGKLGTQLNLNTETIGQISIPLPPIEIQSQIVKYLDKETSNIDDTINKIEEKISLLEEYKKSLIHHVVTGKVDVREAVS